MKIPDTSPVIETSGLSRKFGQKLALNQVSLKIPRGRVLDWWAKTARAKRPS